jgi:UDP-hydrolysing UDP-N-acetyl-D-glucosamine 2-epimerase
MINIGFITGARSDFGVMKPLILSTLKDKRYRVKVYVTGMHLLKKYGYTCEEIENSGVTIEKKIYCYTEYDEHKELDFIRIIDNLYIALKNEELKIVFILGDRIEAYGSALAAHFLKIPIAHYGGGQITEGSVDNIYRYNISNLSFLHFVTNGQAKEILLKIPTINSENVFNYGSTAIDSIEQYLKSPNNLDIINKKLIYGKYVLMTFHSVTKYEEPTHLYMDYCINNIINKGFQILITFPNNDDGNHDIINIINKWKNHESIFIYRNLGSVFYYTAIYYSAFVIGNSSSGIIEVPYFSKYTINIGIRQKGRLSPSSVINIPIEMKSIDNAIEKISSSKFFNNDRLYGDGNSVEKIINKIYENCYKL